MRTYQSGTNDKKKKSSKKVAYIIFLVLALGALATVITLSLTLGKTPIVPPDENPPYVDPNDGLPTDKDPVKLWVMPVSSVEVGQAASLDRVVYSSSMNYWRTHNGVDFLAEKDTAVVAISDGIVTAVQHTVMDASVVTIDHGNGLFSYYKGLSEDITVEVGETVKAGDKVGSIAAVMPFERDMGAHLHLEMKLNGKYVNPANYLSDLSDK